MMEASTDVSAALTAAQGFFQRHLRGSWVPDYLAGRGLGDQLGPARIGYAPAAWDALTASLRRDGHDLAVLQEAGLTRISSTGSPIDVFRDRMTFPVVDADNTLVGFTARANPSSDQESAKYLNSPASAHFHKAELLYALGEDAHQLRRGATPILVEGAMDRLAIRHAAGPVNLVGLASLGTAFTDQHIALLHDVVGRHRPLVVAFDPDDAGRRATVAAWEKLTAARSPTDGALLCVHLPDGDPAGYVETGRAADLRSALMRPVPLAHTVADIKLDAAGSLDHAARHVQVARSLAHEAVHLHPSQVSSYVAHLAHALGMPHEDVTSLALEEIGAADDEDAHRAAYCAAASHPGAAPAQSARSSAPPLPAHEHRMDQQPERGR